MHKWRNRRVIYSLTLVWMISVAALITKSPQGVEAAPEDWWDSNWKNRRAIVINSNSVAINSTDMPILFEATNVTSSARSDGGDIVFTDGVGNKLSHEIEFYDSVSGHLAAWVKVPFLSSSVDTKLYMYYGNPDASNQQDPSGVWDSNFVMVQHLEESSGVRYDSTSRGVNGVVYGGVSKDSAGRIDGADVFNGVNSYVKFPAGFLPTSTITVELWLKPVSYSNVTNWWPKYINTGPTTKSGIYGGQPYLKQDTWTLSMSWNKKATNFTFSFTSGKGWNHLVVAWDGSYCRGYLNGVKVKEAAVGGAVAADWVGKPLYLGSAYNSYDFFNGAVDEVRVSNIARSSGWIQTSYNNQKDPSTFYTIQNEETNTGSGGPPVVSNEDPANGANEIYTNPTLSVRVGSTERMTIIFRTNASGSWEDIKSYEGVGNGKYSAIPTSMGKLGTKYHWRVCATNGTVWTNNTYYFMTTTTILKSKWGLGSLPSTISGVLIADVNGDGLEEVIYAGGATNGTGGRVMAVNGTNGHLIWSVSDPALGFWCQPQIADLNHDGRPEILAPLQSPAGLLALHGADGSTYWRKTGLGGVTFSSPVICDIDGDGYPEIFFCSTDTINPSLNGTGRLTSLSYAGQILHQTFAWRPCSGGLSIADTDSDGHFELYMGDRTMYTSDGGYGKGVRSFWAENLTQRWNYPEVFCSSHIPMLADVNRDGILDVISGHMSGGLLVLNSSDGSSMNRILGIPNDAPVHYQPSIYDIDHDGHLEMLMADGSHDTSSDDIVIWDLVTWKIDKRLYVGKCFYGPQVGDVTGDNIMEIVACNYTGIFIFDKNYSLIAQVTGLRGTQNYAVLQDIDGDGYNEMVVTSQTGRIYAFDTPARSPTPRARSEVQFYSEYRLGAAEYVPPPGRAEPLVYSPSPPDLSEDVPVSLAKLSFSIRDYQHKSMNFTVTTDPDIGSLYKTNVSNGRYNVTVANLQYHTTYTWTINVTNGISWNKQTYRFTTESISKWWNPNWNYRKAVTINHDKVVSDMTDIPILVDLFDSDLKGVAAKVKSDGGDIVFTDGVGNKLSHEIEFYDSVSGHLAAWVKVPFLSSSVDTKLYMYYGNPDASNQQDPSGVWDSNFVMVQHLEESSGVRYDSTSRGVNGVVYGGVSKDSAGKIDGADVFNGVNSYVKFPAGFLPTSTITVELWLKPLSYSNNKYTKYINTGPTTSSGIYGSQASLTKDSWTLSMSWGSKSSSFALSFTSGYVWDHAVVAWDGSYCRGYLNGVKVKEAAVGGVADWVGKPLYLGSAYNSYDFFNGAVDEVRISNIARSSGWIQTSYNNQKDPSTFYTIQNEETIPEAPVVFSPSPIDKATSVPTSLSALSFNITDYQGDQMNYTVITFPDIGSGSGENVANGRRTISVSGLTRSTAYLWSVSVTDGSHQTNYTFRFVTDLGKPPTMDGPPLLSSSGGNLICSNRTTRDADGDRITTIYNWYRNEVPITRLLLPFDTNDTSAVKDYSSNKNDGVIVGGVKWTKNGRVGGAYVFNKGYMKVPGVTTLDGGGTWSQLTVELWVKITTDQSGTRVVSKVPSYEIGFSGTNKIYAGIWTDKADGYVRITSPTSMSKGSWYHVAFTYKSGVGLNLYINGQKVTTTVSATGNIKPAGPEPLYIGWFDYFNGYVDEVRIYSKSLSSQQVSQRWKETKDGLSKNSTILSYEIQTGDSWRCEVTPTDPYQDGTTQSSITIQIGAALSSVTTTSVVAPFRTDGDSWILKLQLRPIISKSKNGYEFADCSPTSYKS